MRLSADFHGHVLSVPPRLFRETQAIGHDSLVATCVERDAVALIAQLAGYALRGMVVLKHLSARGVCAKMVEGQGEQASACFGPVAIAVVIDAERRARW